MNHCLLSSFAKGAALSLTLLGGTQLALAQATPEAEAPAPDEATPAADATPDADASPDASADVDTQPEATRILVVPIASQTAEMQAAATQVTTALSNAAANSGGKVETSAASRAEITDLSECRNEAPECMQGMLDAVGADTLVLGNLVATEGGWILTIKLVRRGESDSISTNVLKGTTPDVLAPQIDKLAAKTFGNQTEASPEDPGPIVVPPTPTPTPGTGFSLAKVNTAAWVVTGAGVGLAAVGATMLVLAAGKQSDVDSAPDATLDDINKLRDLEDTADSYELFGNSFLIAGAVTSVVGLSWAVLQARSGTESEPTAILAPSPTNGGAMVNLTILH